MSRRSRVSVLAMLLIAAQGPASARNQIFLRTNTVVHTAQVSLSDLLPPTAPPEIQITAAKISLGNAPSLSSKRVIPSAEIKSALQKSPALASQFVVPAEIEVTRWSRPLTNVEITQAINTSFPAADVSPEDVTVDWPEVVSDANPKLAVVRIEAARDSVGTHVALSIASQPHDPPFWVTVKKALDQTAQNARHRNPNLHTAASASKNALAASSQAPLIRAGNPIELVVQGSGMRITTKAKALETGREGQQIRVQCADVTDTDSSPRSTRRGGKILIAKVVSAQIVEIDY